MNVLGLSFENQNSISFSHRLPGLISVAAIRKHNDEKGVGEGSDEGGRWRCDAVTKTETKVVGVGSGSSDEGKI